MNDHTKIKLLTIAVSILIGVNVAIVCMVWSRPHPPRPERHGPSAEIIRELDFQGEQLRQFEQLRDEHHQAMMAIEEKGRHTHDALFGLIKTGQDSSALADSLINEIAADRKQIESVTYHHIAQVRKICSPEQQKKFDAIIVNLMARMSQASPGPR
jgi:protein CpxP